MSRAPDTLPLYDGVDAYRASRDETAENPEPDAIAEVRRRVEAIVDRVRAEGDRALVAITRELDGVDLGASGLRVPPERLRKSASGASKVVVSAMRRAAENIRRYHERQRTEGFEASEADGSRLGQRVRPLDVVGVYVPGGAASYPSSVLMTVIPARIAGVPRVVACTPPGAIARSPELAAALVLVGVDEVFALGGAQAVAALAFGTESVPRVDKIVGPGNAYVAEAKRLVFGAVGIDAIAGPSEIVVLADASATPRFVAADLLSQAEHGSGDERAILVTTSRDTAEAVQREMARQLETLPRAGEIENVLRRHGAAVVAADLDAAIGLVNEIAPEHLEILTASPDEVAARILSAGAIFVGEHSPVPIGDFYAGPNHVLPTGGTARFSSPLGVYDFVKRSSVVSYTAERLQAHREDIEAFARAEGFEAHARAVSIRFEP